MASHYSIQNNRRNPLLHRFYEPLVLLYVLDRTQGDQLMRPTAESLPLRDITAQELRRRFLDSLAYICDFDKGGDTMTAIAVSSAPLTYYITCNKTPKKRVAPFIRGLLNQLASAHNQSDGQRREEESNVLKRCVKFSEKRIELYRQFLLESLASCQKALADDLEVSKLSALEQRLAIKQSTLHDLCVCCDSLMKSSDLDYVRDKAMVSEDYGNSQSPFAKVRHFIGRLAYHPKAIRTLMSAADRLPALFWDPQILPVKSPSSLVLPPNLRKKLTLDEIAGRMVSNNNNLLLDLRARLRSLDLAVDLERVVREEYARENFKPRVHAELNLSEYFYQNRQSITFYDNDKFIGTSKPSCYCCFLYIRAHPGGFVEPATHQKIYMNWMPPTSIPAVEDPESDVARHERTMLNEMVESIRIRTIDQIIHQGGPRQKHYDSVTGDTFSARLIIHSGGNDEKYRSGSGANVEKGNEEETTNNSIVKSTLHIDGSENTTDLDDDDSDISGGVSLA